MRRGPVQPELLRRAIEQPTGKGGAFPSSVLRYYYAEPLGGDDDEFFGIETFEDICSMTRVFIKDDSALAAGRSPTSRNAAAIPASRSSRVFSAAPRRARGGRGATGEALFESAIDESRSPMA